MSKTVFTNGCFDIIHAGHVALFTFCRQVAGPDGRVIVAINSDASVMRLKGPDRPVNSLEDRIRVLHALKNIDWVFPFGEDTPIDVIRFLKPDVIVKGGDYHAEEVVGHDVAEVLLFPYDPRYSTTSLIEKIRR